MSTFEERVLARLNKAPEAETNTPVPAPSTASPSSFEERVRARLDVTSPPQAVAQASVGQPEGLTPNTPPVAPVQPTDARDLVSGAIVEPAIETFINTAKQFEADPVGTSIEAVTSTAGLAKDFIKALYDSKVQTALGIGGELAGKATKRIPFAGEVGELVGTTTGKLIEEDIGVGQAVKDSLTEMDCR